MNSFLPNELFDDRPPTDRRRSECTLIAACSDDDVFDWPGYRIPVVGLSKRDVDLVQSCADQSKGIANTIVQWRSPARLRRLKASQQGPHLAEEHCPCSS
jgi:hypothetical protein